LFKVSSLFLFAVLVLGIGAYPPIYSDSNNLSLDSSLIPNVFAQSDSDDGLSDDDDDAREDDDDKDIEIEVEIESGLTKIKVEFDGEETELKYDGFPEDEIISSIIDLTGLTEDEIKAIWDLKQEDGTDDDSEDGSEESNSAKLAEKEARLEEKRKERLAKQEQRFAEREAKLAEREQMALERAEKLIQKLESRIQQLEQRLQNLVEKLDSGEYYGNISDKVAEPKSLILTINGSASQINNSTNQLPLDGTISLSTQVIKDNAKKLKVDGGEIWIGDKVYDVVFGKARSSSSGPGSEKDSLVLIAQTSTGIDDEIKTLKLSIDLSSAIDPQSIESLEVSVLSPQSKIASEWFLSGNGTLSSDL